MAPSLSALQPVSSKRGVSRLLGSRLSFRNPHPQTINCTQWSFVNDALVDPILQPPCRRYQVLRLRLTPGRYQTRFADLKTTRGIYRCPILFALVLFIMDRIADFLQGVGYHAVQIRPLLPMNLHLILSALFPIYAGAHASLSRPSSAAKPPKRKKKDDDSDDDDDEDSKQRMEGMTPLDAVMLPVLAGCTLAGLYFIIKWLEDPAILNKILNWYFSIFGVLALARLITDTMGTISSILFPTMYSSKGDVWKIDGEKARAESSHAPPALRYSPLPGRLSTIPLPKQVKTLLWSLRELPSRRLHIRFYLHKVAHGSFKIGPQGIIGFTIALAAQIYFNLVDKPWWLTNALGFSLAYNALQLLSPTTSWTGTLILGALFIYDIYFVFFTPLMVTVATKLDIPAKLIFPRPSAPGEDPAKRAFSMLGLGDIVLPGMMIGFALRFDLYLFYLRKQTRRDIDTTVETPDSANPNTSTKQTETFIMEKDKWYPATGAWGERFWSSRQAIVTSDRYHGIIFPKTYFHAALIGYVVGMLVTLGVMQIFHHAQPALLYLVPGVLGALWGTAFVKGDIGTLWTYTEAEEEEGKRDEGESESEGKQGDEGWSSSGMKSALLGAGPAGNPKEPPTDRKFKSEDSADESPESEDQNPTTKPNPQHPPHRDRDRKRELLFLSVNLPRTNSIASSEPEKP